MPQETARTIDELVARNFAANTEGELASVPEDVEQVKRPLPPVGHFGYTEEDADDVRKENRRAGATLDTSEAKFALNDEQAAGEPLEPAEFNTERAERASDESAAASDAAANPVRTSVPGLSSRDSGVRESGVSEDGGKPPSRRATNKNKQQAPAGQSRSGAESKGDDGDNSNNPGDESDKR